MKEYKSQTEFVAQIKDNVFRSEESIDITSFNLDIGAGIEVAGNIKAGNIKAGDIRAGDIHAGDINAGNINAWDINAWDINYYAVAFAYKNIKCKKIQGRRENSKHFVLDGKIQIIE